MYNGFLAEIYFVI